MTNVRYLRPRNSAESEARAAHPASRKEGIDSYLARLEEVRVRKDLDPRVRKSIEIALERLLGFIDMVYRLHEAAGGAYSSSSGPMGGGTGGGGPSDTVGERVVGRLGNRGTRNTPLDRYLRKDIVKDFESMTRSLSHMSMRAREALEGRTRRNKLTRAQADSIRQGLQDGSRTMQSYANEHGVSHGTIRNIATGKTWKSDA